MNSQSVVFDFHNTGFVSIRPAVIRSTENGHHLGELSLLPPLVIFVALKLSFVSPNNGKQFVSFQKGVCRRPSEVIAASSGLIVEPNALKVLVLLREGIRPKKVAQGTDLLRLLNSLQLIDLR